MPSAALDSRGLIVFRVRVLLPVWCGFSLDFYFPLTTVYGSVDNQALRIYNPLLINKNTSVSSKNLIQPHEGRGGIKP